MGENSLIDRLFFYYLIFDLLSGMEEHRHSSVRVHAASHKVVVFVFAFLGALKPFFLLSVALPINDIDFEEQRPYPGSV
jgi:hypothetical protein